MNVFTGASASEGVT